MTFVFTKKILWLLKSTRSGKPGRCASIQVRSKHFEASCTNPEIQVQMQDRFATHILGIL